MSRGSGATILRDRNQLGAFDRIRAIREGKGKRSTFLEDSASDGPESPDPPTPPEPSREDLPSRQSSLSSENAPSRMLDSDSDSDDASARPARRRLVKKSQLNDDKEEEEDRRVSVGSPIRGQRRKMGRGLVESDSSDDDEVDDETADDDDDDDYAPANAGDDLSDAIGAVTLSEEPVAYRPKASASVASPRPAPFAPAMPKRVSTATAAMPPAAAKPGPTRATLSVADVITARAKAPSARNEPVPAPKKRAAPAPRPPAPRDSAPAETAVRDPAPAQPRDPRSAGDAAGPHKETHVRPMRLKGHEGGPRFELAGDLAARLYDHQRDGVRWMWNLQLLGRGGILADDMGLGKTLQVAAFASGLLRSGAARRFLVLAPTTLLPHWHKEFIVAGLRDGVNLHKFAGGGSKADRDRALSKVRAHGGVLLTTYGMVLHNDDSLGAPASEEDAEKVAAASGRGAAVAAQDMPSGAKGCHWDWIVCDEGHKLKNPNAQLPRKVRTLPSSHRLIITGTPIQNHLAELWALYDLCCPGLLGDEAEFRREYSKKIAAGQSRDATQRQRSAGARASEELRNKCKPFMLRREKSSVLAKAKEEEQKEVKAVDPEAQNADNAAAGPRTSIEASTTGWAGVKHAPQQLGTKNDLIVWLPLRPAQERLYRAFLKSNTVRSALNKTGSALSAINILKKICDHPALCLAITETSAADAAATSHVARSSPSRSPARDGREEGEEGDEEEEDGDKREARRLAVAAAVAAAGLTESDLGGAPDASGKCAFLMSLIRHLARSGHRTLVFSQSRAMLDVLESAARADGHDLVRIDGKVPADERHARVERFQSTPSIPLALLTSQVGGLGLTLTAADRVVIYDPAWNPAADSQSVDRAYRIGQTRDVVVYRLVTCGTVEEKVYRRQVFKGGLSRAGTQDGNHFRYFSADETSQLFEFSEDAARGSKTQAELERLHAHQRRWTAELANVEAPVIERLGCVGVSDHDLLFSKEDSTKAGGGASVLSAGGGGGGKGGAGGKAAGAKDKGGKGARGGWKGVDAGWGGDARLAGLAIAAGSAAAAPPSSFASSSDKPPTATPKTTRSKAAERLETLMAQRDKQKMLLSMDGMVSRLPDKGRSIEVRIEALEKEIAAAKAELRAKHGAGVPATEASKSAAMAALDAHIARATPARAPPSDKTVQGASEEPRGDGGSDPEVKGAASPRDTDDGVAGDAGEDGDEEVVDVTACADDESIAGTDDGDDAGSSPARSTPAPAPPPSVAVAPGDVEDAAESSDEVFDTAPSTPTGAREVDDLSAMLGGMGVR